MKKIILLTTLLAASLFSKELTLSGDKVNGYVNPFFEVYPQKMPLITVNYPNGDLVLNTESNEMNSKFTYNNNTTVDSTYKITNKSIKATFDKYLSGRFTVSKNSSNKIDLKLLPSKLFITFTEDDNKAINLISNVELTLNYSVNGVNEVQIVTLENLRKDIHTLALEKSELTIKNLDEQITQLVEYALLNIFVQNKNFKR
jgi:plasmid maintenance system killer protein|tara:strand:- start:8581 stop:9183 length:603 start_codon:yes stop_codon:yes gene_type:complete